jgi:hypothetical protein
MDISKQAIEKIERKPLGEDGWIDLGEIYSHLPGVKIRFDYLTQAQDTEFKHLLNLWELGLGGVARDQPFNYLFRCSVKEVIGVTWIDKEMTLTFKYKLAHELVTTEKKESEQHSRDVVDAFKEDMRVSIDLIGEMIWQRIQMTEADKKKLQSVQNSAKTENSQGQEKNLSPA